MLSVHASPLQFTRWWMWYRGLASLLSSADFSEAEVLQADIYLFVLLHANGQVTQWVTQM